MTRPQPPTFCCCQRSRGANLFVCAWSSQSVRTPALRCRSLHPSGVFFPHRTSLLVHHSPRLCICCFMHFFFSPRLSDEGRAALQWRWGHCHCEVSRLRLGLHWWLPVVVPGESHKSATCTQQQRHGIWKWWQRLGTVFLVLESLKTSSAMAAVD